jgi:hypothetical protein
MPPPGPVVLRQSRLEEACLSGELVTPGDVRIEAPDRHRVLPAGRHHIGPDR